jgi:hypothetical protein
VKELSTEIRWQGQIYRQIKRDGLIAIYEVRGDGERLLGFEVIKIQVHAAGELLGRWYPHREG